MAVPTRFMRDWVANHYSERLREIWRLENPTVRRVVIHVRPPGAPPPPQANSMSAAGATVVAVQPARPLPVEAPPPTKLLSASSIDRVCQYVSFPVVARPLKTKT